MYDKKQQIIEVGMKLFAERGFHSTSIQEIADHCGISKGAFYLHFKSKKDFTVAIYRYYYDTVKNRLDEVGARTDLSPWQKFELEIEVFFEEFMRKKEFIIMHFQEHFSIHKELEVLVFKMRIEAHAWYEKNLLEIYGDEVKPFIVDGIILIEGLVDSYMKVILFDGVDLDLKEFSKFLARRADDVIRGMLNKQEKPQLNKAMFKPLYQINDRNELREKVNTILVDMKERLPNLVLEKTKFEDLDKTLDFLLKEVKKEEPEKIIFQGMLSNFHGVSELEDFRQQIADLLEIKLIS